MTKRQRTRRPTQDQAMNNSSSPVIRDVRLEWSQDSLQVQTIHSNEHDRYMIESLNALHAGVKASQGAFSLPFDGWLMKDGERISCEEFRKDYNRHHFVRNGEFDGAAEQLDPETRKVFVEFLEQSCTSEFSGFLLYKELSRRIKTKNPLLAECFSHMAWSFVPKLFMKQS